MQSPVSIISCLVLLSSIDSTVSLNDELVTYKQLEDIVQPLKSRIRELESEVEEIKENSVSRRALGAGGVAFSAVLVGSLQHIGLNQVIKFNSVALNEGNGYSSYTGIFTAPFSGVYLFSYSFSRLNVGQTWLQLVHNGVRINSAVTDGFNEWENDQSGNVAVLKLADGDTVWIESWHQDDAELDGTGGFTTFSGVMIYQHFHNIP